jgi:hypothetical protein
MAGAGMSSQSMNAIMSSMLILAAPAFLVVAGIAVMAYRKWKSDRES